MRPLMLLLVLMGTTVLGGELEITTSPDLAPEVLDGDTLRVWIIIRLEVDPTTQVHTLRQHKIRLKDFDAWESTRHRRTVYITPDEIERGKRAKEYMEGLLKDHEIKLLTEYNSGAFDRLEGTIMRKNKTSGLWESVAILMDDAGHTRLPHSLDGQKRWGEEK